MKVNVINKNIMVLDGFSSKYHYANLDPSPKSIGLFVIPVWTNSGAYYEDTYKVYMITRP